MKSYHYKLILSLFAISTVIILILGNIFLIFPGLRREDIAKIVMIAIFVLALASMVVAIITLKKVIEPMSKMLKSGNSYDDIGKIDINDDEIDDIVKELRIKLKDANNKQRQTDTILEHLTDGIILFDIKGKVTYTNPAAILMLELKSKEDTFDKIFSKYNDINMEKIIYLENWTSSEKMIENNQGSMNLFFVPFKDEINRPTGVMVVIQDITEHVKLDNMRKEFVADVSHELKTPLTSIKGCSETLLDGDVDKESADHFIQLISDNANRMEKLVQDLLILSRYDRKEDTHKIVEFDLGELSKKCVEKFEIEVKRKKQTIQCLVTAEVPPVKADKDGIERVILNIISNSVKYTPEGGKIDVFVGFVHNDAYIKIKDTGIGIPKEDLDKIFERFYRVDKARSREMGGTGLGLSIAKQIIEQNKGNISVTSKLGEGTEVVIRIPVKNK